MNTKVGRRACARRPFIFKATVRRLDWMVMALICLCARALPRKGHQERQGRYILVGFWENGFQRFSKCMTTLQHFRC